MTAVIERIPRRELDVRRSVRSHGSAIAIALWAILVGVAAPSLVGPADVRGGARILLPIAVGAVIAFYAPRASTMPWRRLVVVSVVAAAAWTVSLALVDGVGGLTRPLTSRYDYLHDVPLVGDSPRAFLDGFTRDIRSYTTHVQGHPPGALLTFWALEQAGLGGAGWAAGLVIAAGASATAAALVSVRELAGERIARRAAPFLALTPAAVWIATSADALFLGVSAWGIALLAVAGGRHGGRGVAFAVGGGLLLGAALYLSYGVVPLAAVAIAVCIARGGTRTLLIAGLALACVVAAFAFAGFWWFDGLRATAQRYSAGAARHRPYARALVLNLGAFAAAAGPAVGVALARLRDRKVWIITGAALLAIALADLSGLSKGEVERIWLLFVPWVSLAAVALAGRGWLAMQAITAVVLQVVLRSPW